MKGRQYGKGIRPVVREDTVFDQWVRVTVLPRDKKKADDLIRVTIEQEGQIWE